MFAQTEAENDQDILLRTILELQYVVGDVIKSMRQQES